MQDDKHVEVPAQWTTETSDAGWEPVSDVHAAVQMASWIHGGEEGEWDEDVLEWASRLLPQVCREYGEDQDRRQVPLEATRMAQPLPPAKQPARIKVQRRGPTPTVANTRKHMVWQEVRAAALKQKKHREKPSPEE